MEPKKLIRLSLSGVEYQFEYIPTPIHLKRDTNGAHNAVTEYRVRRGGVGTWTRWYKTNDIGNTIQNLGFGRRAATVLNDFTFESILGRGEIPVSRNIVVKLSNAAGFHPAATHLFSRLKKTGDDAWALPSSALVDREAYAYLKELIRKS
jgi:hypothetical protein